MIKGWGVTDKGMVRQQNQDGYYLDIPSEELAVAVVCDGMGGARAGNIASRLAILPARAPPMPSHTTATASSSLGISR